MIKLGLIGFSSVLECLLLLQKQILTQKPRNYLQFQTLEICMCVFWFKTPLFLPHPFLLHLAVSIAMPYLAVNKGQQDQI